MKLIFMFKADYFLNGCSNQKNTYKFFVDNITLYKFYLNYF